MNKIEGTMLVLLFILLGCGASRGQSLGELARKTKAENKGKKTVIVITNDVLKAKSADTTGEGARPDGMAAVSGGADETAPQNGESKTTKIILPNQEDVRQDSVNQRYLRRFEELYAKAVVAIVNYEDAEQRNDWWKMCRHAQELLALQRQFDDLKENARKDSVPPGVIRDAEKDILRQIRDIIRDVERKPRQGAE